MSYELPLSIDELLELWPNCTTPDCDAKVCLGLSETLCYPCATGKPRGPDGKVLVPATREEVDSWQDKAAKFWERKLGVR